MTILTSVLFSEPMNLFVKDVIVPAVTKRSVKVQWERYRDVINGNVPGVDGGDAGGGGSGDVPGVSPTKRDGPYKGWQCLCGHTCAPDERRTHLRAEIHYPSTSPLPHDIFFLKL